MAAHPTRRGWPIALTLTRTRTLTLSLSLAWAAAAAAQGSAVGTGAGKGPGTHADLRGPLPTPAQAEVQHRDTLRKCWPLPVAAVRAACQRQAQRTLDQQLAQWHQQRSHPWHADGAVQPAVTLATGASRSR